jgi:hypothetical protein
MDNLSLSKAERRIEGPLHVFGGRTVWTDSFAALTTEFPSASKTVSQLPELNYARHGFQTPIQFTDSTQRPVLTFDVAASATLFARVPLRAYTFTHRRDLLAII